MNTASQSPLIRQGDEQVLFRLMRQMTGVVDAADLDVAEAVNDQLADGRLEDFQGQETDDIRVQDAGEGGLDETYRGKRRRLSLPRLERNRSASARRAAVCISSSC